MKQLNLLWISVLCLVTVTANAQDHSNPVSIGTVDGLISTVKQNISTSEKRKSKPMVSLKISESTSLPATINYRKSESGEEYLVGQIANRQDASFHLKVSGNSLEGNIVLKESKEAYKYFSDAQGNAFIEKVDIHDVLCIDFNNSASNTSATDKGAKMAISPAVANLESYPGARGCVLLDYDGQYVSGTPWNNGNPINAAPSGMSDAAIQESWEIVAEDFRPFHVNVTTNEAVFNSYPKTMRMRCIITPTNTAAPGAGGVAYIGSFRWNDDTPCWVFITSGKGSAEAASHEVGHTFGLGHDGRTNPSEGYFRGHGDWAPIMGVGYYEPITQWSKGEYNYANNTEDDLSKITSSTYNVGYRPDDHGNSISSATALKMDASGNVSASTNNGIIERTTDLDYFSFNTSGGSVTLNFNPAARHGDLDILVRLYNSSGTQIATSNPSGLSASLNVSLTQGNYYISIDGTGAGDPASNGYSDYASLGYFSISGKIPAGNNNNNGVATFYQHCNFSTSGYVIALEPGQFTTAQLIARGIKDNDISSLTIQSGYEVVVFQNDNFQGASFAFSANDECLVDNGINDYISSIIVRTVTENKLPTVSLTSPSNGSVFNAPATITVSANASDPDGTITKVEFYSGSVKIGEDVTSPFSITWNNVSAGSYVLTARATDNNGAPATSGPINITVNSVTNDNCAALAQYTENGGYVAGSKVKNVGKRYECKPWPYSGWCNGAAWAYAPGTGAYWQDAWIETGSCTAARSGINAEESSTAGSVQLAPNPAFERLTIEFDMESDRANVQIVDAYGVEILSLKEIASGEIIDISEVKSSVYTVIVTSGNQLLTERLVIE